jgi:hypothetical protein
MNNLKRLKMKTGLSIYPILGILLVVLKITNQIEISWVWATSPFWIPFLTVFISFLGLLVFGVIVIGLKKILE